MADVIMCVEDDERIRAMVRLVLEEEGYEVHEVATGEEATRDFAGVAPSVVLVDLTLPGMSGFEVCRELRRTSDVLIVVVSARTDTADIVAGLEAGADDYVTKPFDAKVLAARLRALLRRSRGAASSGPEHVFGDLTVAPEAGEVRVGGEPVNLTKTEFRLLCEFAENAGRVLSREQLLERVWGYDYFGDSRLVDAHVRRLRTKIESDAAGPRHVVTVRGLGYKLQP